MPTFSCSVPCRLGGLILFFDALLCDVITFHVLALKSFYLLTEARQILIPKVKTTANQIVLILSFQIQKIHRYGRLKMNRYKHSQ